MITELKREICPKCKIRGYLIRVGRRHGFDIIDGCLSDCDFWKYKCEICGHHEEVPWEACPKW